jgi:hypothetical protein
LYSNLDEIGRVFPYNSEKLQSDECLNVSCIIKITYIAVTPTCFYPSCCIVSYIPIMDISADKVYNTNQTDAPKKILMGMQIE